MDIFEKPFKSRTRAKLELVLAFFVTFLIINVFLFSAVVHSSSMNPNFIEGERSIMFKKTIFNKVNHGNVVVIDYQDESQKKKRFFKRIIGLPNDTIEIKKNIVYINGSPIEEPYLAKDSYMEDYPLTILKNDEFFAMGDNRSVSLDSRKLGAFKLKDIKAMNGVVYWPLNKIGIMK